MPPRHLHHHHAITATTTATTPPHPSPPAATTIVSISQPTPPLSSPPTPSPLPQPQPPSQHHHNTTHHHPHHHLYATTACALGYNSTTGAFGFSDTQKGALVLLSTERVRLDLGSATRGCLVQQLGAFGSLCYSDKGVFGAAALRSVWFSFRGVWPWV
ncbi:hypothetical protein Tco_1304850 [Tanacetum coccineum]